VVKKMTRKKRFLGSKKARITLLAVSILMLVVGATMLVEGQNMTNVGNREKENAILTLKGELMPFEINMSKDFVVLFGGVGTVCSVQDLANGINLNRSVNIGVSYPVQIRFVNNKLSVSAEIKNADNVTIADTVNNEWTPSPNPSFVRDRNYNSFAFEVVDSDSIPVLQVIVVGDNRIRVGLSAFGQGGRVIVTQSGEVYLNPSEQAIGEMRNSTMFKYPSSSHFGEMVNPISFGGGLLSESARTITVGLILQATGITFAVAFSISGTLDVVVMFRKRGGGIRGEVGGKKTPTDTENKTETEEGGKEQRQYYELRLEDKEKRKGKRG
jgi:hypothetical protein